MASRQDKAPDRISRSKASELRDRIRSAKVRVTVIDKLARKQYEIEPGAYESRRFINWRGSRSARLLGDAYAEVEYR